MAVDDLIGTSPEPVVFTGAQIPEFLEMCKEARQLLDYDRLAQAKRIVGTLGIFDADAFGYVCTRVWKAEY